MARLVRMVVAGVPRHVTQRDSRQLPMFFRNEYGVPRFTRVYCKISYVVTEKR